MSRISIRIGGNNKKINNEDPKFMMTMIPHKNGIELPFCGRCYDFKPSWEMFNTLQCGHNFCRVCMHEHVASNLRGNSVIVSCPDSNCKVEYGPDNFFYLLPLEVFRRWKKVIIDCNTPILDKQFKKHVIHVDDDEENNSYVEEDDYEYIKNKKSNKKKKKRGRNIY